MRSDAGVVSSLTIFFFSQEKLGNQKDVRLEMLRHEMYKTHASILWLRDNKHLFREEVFEPICMYVNVTDSKFAAEVESMIPRHLMTVRISGIAICLLIWGGCNSRLWRKTRTISTLC